MRTKLFAVLLLSLLLLAQAASLRLQAKGPPQKVTISGGDLTTEIEITGDEAILSALGTMILEDFDTRTSVAPEGSDTWGDGYLITRYFENQGGRMFAFDEVRYYPDPEGGRGYIHYSGIFSGSSEYDGQWFRADSNGEAVLQSVIAGEGSAATAQPSVGASGILNIFLNALAAFVGAQ